MNEPNSPDVYNDVTGRTALLNTVMMEVPLYLESQRAAIDTLLAFGANPLLTSSKPGIGSPSPLLSAVLQLNGNLVKDMLEAISVHRHADYPVLARPEPCNELARSFFKLMQTPRSVRITRGATNYKKSYSELVKFLLVGGIATELPFACRTCKYDPLGLASYYGNDEAAEAMVNISSGIDNQFFNTIHGDEGLEILMGAINCGFSEVINILLPRMMVREDIAGYNVLISGVHNQPNLIPQVYSYFEAAGKGCKLLEYVDPWGATALDTALEYDYLDLAKYLLAKGATYDQYRLKGDHRIDEGKQSTLASVLPRMKPVKFLMELDPKPNLVVTESGLNVFHILALDEKLIGMLSSSRR
jgi:hypothetical protein